MTGDQWAALGVIATLGVAAVGGVLKWTANRRSDQVRIAIAAPTYHTAEQGLNSHFAFSIGVQIMNAGPGVAFDLCIGTIDPDHVGIASEWQMLPALGVGAVHVTYFGIHGKSPDDDPDPQDAWGFYERLVLMVTCWDRRGRQYLFTPAGGGVVRRKAKVWKDREHMYQFMHSSDPSRGEPPLARGIGKVAQD